MKATGNIRIPDLIRVHQAELTRLCQLHQVKALFLFGSALTDRFRLESDIDLLITFHPMEVLNYSSNYFELKEKLEQVLGRSVDLLESQTLRNPILKAEINARKYLLYGDPDREMAH